MIAEELNNTKEIELKVRDQRIAELWAYVRHTPTCKVHITGVERQRGLRRVLRCSCGLDALLAGELPDAADPATQTTTEA